MQNSAATAALPYSNNPPGWSAMVAQIAEGDEAAMETFYRGFAGIRKFLGRKWGRDDVEDMLHDTWVETVVAIRAGLRNPERVWGLARKVARSKVAKRCARAAAEQTAVGRPLEFRDRQLNPEQRLLSDEPIRTALGALSERDREILTRFYLREETEEEIRAVMKMTSTQFRLAKSRAKARFGEAGKGLSMHRAHPVAAGGQELP